MNIIKKYRDIALSNDDVLRLVKGKANMLLYRNLHKFDNIDDILGPYGACFLLFEWKERYGHWTLIFKVNDHTLEFFNPYGGMNKGYPDEGLKHVPKNFAKRSYQDYPYLSILMDESPYDLTYNEFPFQKYGDNIKTCGRWCSVRLLFRFLDLDEFADMFKRNDGDDLVTLLTMYINK